MIAATAIVAAVLALAWYPAIASAAPPARAAFDPALVRRGEQLASLGDCSSCHSAPEGPAYAGGAPLQTPFGTVYATNITPDPRTGIGRWTEADFRRALREGVSRDGHLLYPAFPYDHFTHLSDADIGALYAFMMTRDPASAPMARNHLRFPFGFRPLIAGWNAMYLRPGPVPQQPGRSPEWQRGAYLVESIGHCGACHTPRTRLGGELPAAPLAGGEIEGLRATALNGNSPSPVPWTVDTLAAYLHRPGAGARDHRRPDAGRGAQPRPCERLRRPRPMRRVCACASVAGAGARGARRLSIATTCVGRSRAWPCPSCVRCHRRAAARSVPRCRHRS